MEEGKSYRATFVLGFHGCDAAIARAIFSGRTAHLNPSQNRFDWLGSGTYFWEASPARALQYARTSMTRPSPRQRKIREPAIIGAVLDLGHCLDLLDSQYFDLVRHAYGHLEKFVRDDGRSMPINRPLGGSADLILRDLDCSVINLIHDNRRAANLRPFDSVRAAFIEGKPLYPGASFYDPNHIQICIRNPGCIKGYFRPVS